VHRASGQQSHTPGRAMQQTHTPKRALVLAADTHTPGAPSAAAFPTPGAPTYGSLWQQEPHTRWARLRQQPLHTSRLCPAASHTQARAIPSNRWSSRRAFTAGGSLQAHGVMREVGTRARAPAHTFFHHQPLRQSFYLRAARPLNVFWSFKLHSFPTTSPDMNLRTACGPLPPDQPPWRASHSTVRRRGPRRACSLGALQHVELGIS
jgi:hypothetical protein